MTDPVKIYSFPEGEVPSDLYAVAIGDTPLPLYAARVSAGPINSYWPGHQRDLIQTEEAAFALFGVSGPVFVTVSPKEAFSSCVVRPRSADVAVEKRTDAVRFTLPGPGFYTVEFDGPHHALHLFADDLTHPIEIPNVPADKLRYFGPGLHEAGVIELHSEEVLYLDEGAVVFGRVIAENQKNIRILGHGILDGSHVAEEILRAPTAEELAEFERTKHHYMIMNAKRYNAIQFRFCENITVDGITVRDSPLYHIRPTFCRNTRIENVKLIGAWRYNTDGIDMHNCEHTVIRNCFLCTFDDCICLKGCDWGVPDSAMDGPDGRRHDLFSDVLVEKCVLWCDWGRALEVGAETVAREMKDFVFRDCDVIHLTHIACDVQNMDEAVVKNVTYENIRVEADGPHPKPYLQTEENEPFRVRETPFFPRLATVTIKDHITNYEQFRRPWAEIGKNEDVTFKDLAVFGDVMPETVIEGHDAEHLSDRIRLSGWTLNGKPLTADTAALTFGDYCGEVTFDGQKIH